MSSKADLLKMLDEICAEMKVKKVLIEKSFKYLEEEIATNDLVRKRALLPEVRNLLAEMKLKDEGNIKIDDL